MGYRIRHCVECPKCRICYVIGRSPYANGSCLIPTVAGSQEEYALYCSCSRMGLLGTGLLAMGLLVRRKAKGAPSDSGKA